MKVGLVLSGGGALGAYQVGVIRALAERNIELHAISGASIGALNGAVIASSSSMQEASEKLHYLWELLVKDNPLKINSAVYLKLLIASGLSLNANTLFKFLDTPPVKSIMMKHLPGIIDLYTECSLLDDAPLKKLLTEYLDTEALKSGLPLYISVFESEGVIKNIVQCMTAELGIVDTKDSDFIHVQKLSVEEQKEALLASIALPLLFKPKNIGGKEYVDGGIGGWNKNQGNTPVQSLIDAGCNVVLVSHLADGSLWSRFDFPEVTIIELRPQANIARNDGLFGGAKDLLGFNPKSIHSWIDQGYIETSRTLDKLKKPLEAKTNLRSSESKLQDNLMKSKLIDDKLADFMSKI